MDRLQFAIEISQEAGENTLRYFQRDNFRVETKADATPVTVADRSTEELLRKRIIAEFPDDAILGEEMPSRPGTSGYRWILDPIDGTKAFIHGVPLYGVLVGVEFGGESVIGVIRIPALGECVYAQKGGGAWYVKGENAPTPAHVSTCANLADALVCTTEEKTYYACQRYEPWRKLLMASRLARGWGDCYGYLLVATGRADVMVDPEMSLWDTVALYPVIREAGGVFTDWRGVPTHTSADSAASNGLLHEQVLKILQE